MSDDMITDTGDDTALLVHVRMLQLIKQSNLLYIIIYFL